MTLQSFDDLTALIRRTMASFPDERAANARFSMEDIGLSAFSVFLTQSPSFLAYQRGMQEKKGLSNAQTVFKIDRVPTDNHIRQTLDEVQPKELFPVYDAIYESLIEQGVLVQFQGFGGTTGVALDATWFHNSEKIHCPNCSHIEHKDKEKPTQYYHSAITPVIVAPGQKHAIALRPEFITPQDGHTKQDCEIAAGKRWLEAHSSYYLPGLGYNVTYLGDDLYAHQPFCRQVWLHQGHFIFVCKPESHTHLYNWVNLLEEGRDLHTVALRRKNKGTMETHTCRYANDVPLVEGADAVRVNWCEVTVTGKKSKVLYHNTFITDWTLTEDNVHALVALGRARWKIENENNNTLKTKGYHLEHNFGHGQKHLSSLLASMNMLALLSHTFLHYRDQAYRLIRDRLVVRRTFFEHIRALTCYLCFPSWAGLMDFMMRGLEIGPYAPPEEA